MKLMYNQFQDPLLNDARVTSASFSYAYHVVFTESMQFKSLYFGSNIYTKFHENGQLVQKFKGGTHMSRGA
jgi:hypothetical protein